MFLLIGCSKKDKPKEDPIEEADISAMDEAAVLTVGVDEIDPSHVRLLDSEEKMPLYYIQNFMYEPLFTEDDTMKMSPLLASWEVEDPSTYLFTLKEDITWHDGEPLTMDDWAFALELLATADEASPYYKGVDQLAGIESYRSDESPSIAGIEVVSEKEMRITFRSERADQLDSLWAYPLPEHIYEDESLTDLSEMKDPEELIGTGPFYIESMDDERIELARNENYWQEEPYLAGVEVKAFSEEEANQALEEGKVDVLPIRHQVVPYVEELENIKIDESPSLAISYIGFRFPDEKGASFKYDSVKVRQAMYYGIDREQLIKDSQNGKAELVDGPLPSSHEASQAEGLNTYAYDPEKAETLLDEAGFEDLDDDGYRKDEDGESFTIQLTHYDGPGMEERAEALIDYWKAIGLNAELETGEVVDYETYEELTEDNELEVFFGTLEQASLSPATYWHSSSPYNMTNWSNEEADELLEEALFETFDEAEQLKLYEAWQKEINKDLPALFLWEAIDLYALQTNVQDVKIQAQKPFATHLWYKTK